MIARLAERTPLDRLELQRLRKRKLWLKDQIVKIETGLDEGITQAVISPLLISVLTNSNVARNEPKLALRRAFGDLVLSSREWPG